MWAVGPRNLPGPLKQSSSTTSAVVTEGQRGWFGLPALHAQLLGGPPKDAADSARAARNYEVLAKDAPARSPWQGGLTAQIFLGDADFAARMQALASASQTQATDIPRSQRLPALSFSLCLQRFGERAQALQMVHVEGGLSMSALAREIGLSISRVSGLIASTRGGVRGGGGGQETRPDSLVTQGLQ